MSDLGKLLRELRRDGYAVTKSRRRGHWHVRDAGGRLVAVAAGSPSDWRSLRNLRSQLRRAR